MKVYIATDTHRAKFEAFVEGHVLGNLWQSWKWGEFQAGVAGRGAFWPILVEDGSGNVRGSALIVRQQLPFGKCWFLCMYGPLIEPGTKVWGEFLGFVKRLAAREKAVYMRIEPGWEDSGDSRLRGNDNKAHARYSPEWTLLIDLSLSEKEILSGMKQKGRYNIRLAEKKGVAVSSAAGEAAVANGFVKGFFDLLAETTRRDGFSGHALSYYEKMFRTLGDQAEVFVARHQGDVLAAIIVTYFKETATYYYGASANHKRELMAPYLLQWRALLAAKERGCKVYDFFGVAGVMSLRAQRSNPLDSALNDGIASVASLPRNDSGRGYEGIDGQGDFAYDKNHPWAGVTEFKLKFGGRVMRYAPAQELVFRSGLYFAMRAAKKLRGWR